MSEALALKEEPLDLSRFPSIYIVHSQYLSRMRDANGNMIEKFVSPQHVRAAFTNEPIDSGWLSPNVIRWGMNPQGEWVVSFVPPQSFKLPFIGEDKEDGDKITELTVPLPGLIFFGNGGKFSLWAVKTKSFDRNAQLYYCPLPNVEGDASLCYGHHKPPRASGNSIGQAFSLFVNTPFNNHTVDNKSKSNPEDVRVILRRLNEEQATEYPLDDLVPFLGGDLVTVDLLFNGFLAAGTL